MTRFARRPLAATVISLIALFVAGSAVAAPRTPTPASLVLRESDFPTRTQYTSGDIPSRVIQALKRVGIQARGVYFGATIPFGSGKSETVSGAVYTTANSSQAKKAYVLFKRETSGSKLPLPLYGDEQIVQYKSGSEIENMTVRRNGVVWQLSVQSLSLLNLSKAQLTAELKKYAAKQRSRVGAG
jgi:hypothetical protein